MFQFNLFMIMAALISRYDPQWCGRTEPGPRRHAGACSWTALARKATRAGGEGHMPARYFFDLPFLSFLSFFLALSSFFFFFFGLASRLPRHLAVPQRHSKRARSFFVSLPSTESL